MKALPPIDRPAGVGHGHAPQGAARTGCQRPRSRRLNLLGWVAVTSVLAAAPSLARGQEGLETDRKRSELHLPTFWFQPAQAGAERGRSGLIDINVRDTDLSTVLEMLSQQARTNIVTSSSVTGRISANLYSVTTAQALDALLTPNKLAYRQVGNTIFVGTEEEIAAQGPAPQTRVFTLKYVTRSEAESVLRTFLGPRGVVSGASAEAGPAPVAPSAAAAAPGGGDAGTDYVLVTAQPADLSAAARVLAEIDVRPRQVLIEATILRATLNEGEELGIDFTLLAGVDFQNVASVSNAAADVTTGRLRPGDFERTTMNFNTGFAGNVSPGGFTFGVIHNNLGVFLKALEEVTDVTVVANPKVLALNKQQAEVIVGRRDGYLTTTVTQTAAVQSVEFLETGTQVKIRPIINPDGSVRLQVHPKDSSGGLSGANLPFEETTEAKAEILVQDGHTVMIGGLFRERTVASRSQIPVLGNIPLVGVLFQSHNDRTIREEVIILLTVHVLKETGAEATQFAGLLDDVERFRVGSRRGLNGLGRERLAQAYYHEAVRQAERNEDDLALLNARMALHNMPRHQGALRLKENLQCRRMWDVDGSRVRTLLMQLIAEAQPGADADAGRGLLGRPPAAEPAPLRIQPNAPPPSPDGDAP
jgi:type IV pilus assembly protein PilQ